MKKELEIFVVSIVFGIAIAAGNYGNDRWLANGVMAFALLYIVAKCYMALLEYLTGT